MEYYYFCPKCGSMYGYESNSSNICQSCNISTVYSGYTDDQWGSLNYKEKQAVKDRVMKGNIEQKVAKPIEFKPNVSGIYKKRSWKEFVNRGEANQNNYQNYQGSVSINREAENKYINYEIIKNKADSGDAEAAQMIGVAMLAGEYGNQLPQNELISQAKRYLKTAADFGLDESEYFLGTIYEGNYSASEKNLEQAILYYSISARKNNRNAQFALSRVLFSLDRSEWLHWACCAYLNGDEDAEGLLNKMIQSSEEPNKTKELIEYKISQIKEYGIEPR